MLREPEFKPTPREEEILAKCVDYEQFREEIDALEAKVETLEKDNVRLKAIVKVLMLKNGVIYKEA